MFSKGKDHLCLFVCTCVSLLALPASVALKWEKRRIKDSLGVWPRPQFLGWAVLYLTLVSVTQKCVPPPQRRASNKPPDGRQLEQHALSQSEYVYDCIMASWCHLGHDEWDFIGSYRAKQVTCSSNWFSNGGLFALYNEIDISSIVSCLRREYFKTSQA